MDKSKTTEPLYLHPSAVVEGDVRFGQDVSIWPTAVIRTESAPVIIGDAVNIQDGVIIHTDPDFPVQIGDRVTLGHRALVHGATIEQDALIGMGAIVMNGAVIGEGSIVGAGALVPQGKQIPPRSLVMGMPGKVIRLLSDDEVEHNRQNAAHYVQEAKIKSGSTGTDRMS